MKFVRVPPPSGQDATHLWVMLPGAYMKPDDFIRAGFADAIRARRLPHAIDLLDADIGDLVDGSALSFLQEHLRASDSLPARRVCLLGISLGAQLAMLCLARAASDASQASQRVAHALVMAPYLGPRDLVAEVAAGGPDASPATGSIDAEREIWRWLRNPAAARPPLYLGYGTEDRFAHAHALMAKTLPRSRVDTQPGGHAWPVWAALWERHLDGFDG